jgi:hypothetical protein
MWSHYSATTNILEPSAAKQGDTFALSARTVQIDNTKMLATSYRIIFPISSRERGQVVWYFEHRFFDSRLVSKLHEQLPFIRAFGLLTSDDERQLAEAQKTDPLSSVYVVVRYDGDLSCSPFLHSGHAIDRPAYTQYVRQAMWKAVGSDPEFAYRGRVLNDERVWEQVSQIGNPQLIRRIFPDLNEVQGAVAASDYLKAAWWSDAMSGTSQAFAKLWTRATQTPGITAEDPDLQVAQQSVARCLGQISRLDNPQSNFHEPWGLLALDLAFGQQAAAEITITGVGPPIRRKRVLVHQH